ncbi:MAG: type 4a pilus biogenesis protein PilO [Dissulfurispiraceae bacterium]|jgi:type IV pilus assembly protein PilO|nr:type 4a pilus biogenesis protein PilO [Dissulfurispiraceae bacterium]
MQLTFDTENMTPGRKKLLLAMPPLVIILVALIMFIMPAMEEINKIETELKNQGQQLALAKQKAGKLSSLIAENEDLKVKIKELELQLPDEKEVSTLLRQVSELGIRSGLNIISWKPKGKNMHSSKEIYEIPVDVEMRGNYHMFGQFFSNITKLSRIVNLNNANIKSLSQQKGSANLGVTFTAVTYSLIPEKERQEMAAKEMAAKGKAKKK